MKPEHENTQLSTEELRSLYGDDYVKAFENQDIRRLERLIPLIDLNSEMTVADFACGNGLLLDIIHDKVRHYHGVDFSDEFIHAAQYRRDQRSITNADFHCESIIDFCTKNAGRFDRTFIMDFSEHVYDGNFIEILKAIRLSMKPGGKLYMHTPNGRFIVEILKDRGVLKQFPEHIAVRNREQNRRLLESAGFRSIRSIGLAHYIPHLRWLHFLSSIPGGGGDYFTARLFFECSR